MKRQYSKLFNGGLKMHPDSDAFKRLIKDALQAEKNNILSDFDLDSQYIELIKLQITGTELQGCEIRFIKTFGGV